MQLLLETTLLLLCAAIAAVGYGSGLSSILRIKPNLGDRGMLGLLTFGFLLSENHYISGWYGVLNADSFVAILLLYWTCLALGLSGSRHVLTDVALLVLSAVLAVALKVSAAPLLLPTLG